MRGFLVFLAVVALGGGAVLVARDTSTEPPAPRSSPAPAAVVTAADASLPTITVYKSPTCGCCGSWIEHLKAEGFTVEVEDVVDLAAVKTRFGIPGELESCHTGVIGDYVVEGHVPAADLKRFLAEAPAAAGLAVPGMPLGSPGMEVPGQPGQPYQVLAFARDGTTEVFAQH
jgi:hypothetical protein